MKYLIFLFLLGLVGCAPAYRHSWLIVDNKTDQCYYLYSSTIGVDSNVSWSNAHGDTVGTSDDFDLRLVHLENYEEAARELNVDPKSCVNGLIKSR